RAAAKPTGPALRGTSCAPAAPSAVRSPTLSTSRPPNVRDRRSGRPIRACAATRTKTSSASGCLTGVRAPTGCWRACWAGPAMAGVATSPAAGSSYGQILKSTAMIGGSSLVNVAFSVLRMKAIAVLLGPGGVGLMSLYTSMADLTQTLAGLGIQASGVRQIAEAAGTGDE